MKYLFVIYKQGSVLPIALIVTAILGAVTFLGLNATVFNSALIVDMRTEPQQGLLRVGESFQIKVIVESNIPVNAFAGKLIFNNDVLTVASINYNTSMADLWVEEPWYSKGDGTITFAGGTTQNGGFVGKGILLTVTFNAKQKGAGQIAVQNARVLQHDGLGTDAQLQQPIDTIFTVESTSNSKADVLRKSSYGTAYVVTKEKVSTDLNGDGKQTIADISIFMLHLASGNSRSDFNEDGKVNVADLSILMDSK